ncbi:MAG: hypothetical protein PHR28_10660 [candidate division Zixibacteria bacterium]|nr:hypothetical protein [candidate division Zixibacteria bacterium]
MAEKTYIPKAKTDDGWITPTNYYNDSDSYDGVELFGNSTYWGGSVSMAVRFPDVDIPGGVVITSAFVRLTANMDNSDTTVNAAISMNDADNPTALTSRSDFVSRDRTGSVDWDNVDAVTGNNTYDTPDISTIVQAVVDRDGWASGNAMLVFIEDNSSSTNVVRGALTYDYYVQYPQHTKYAQLHIEYSESIPEGDMPLVAHAPSKYADEIPAADMGMTELNPLTPIVSCPIPVAAMTFLPRNPAYIWIVPKAVRATCQKIYICVLTGAADGVDDVELPMSSFQGRLRDGEPSYIAAVIPNSALYEADVTARPNGEIVIKMGYLMSDGTRALEEIARVTYETMQLDRGAKNDSMTITGHKTVTSTAPKERKIENDDYAIYGVAGGEIGQGSIPGDFSGNWWD